MKLATLIAAVTAVTLGAVSFAAAQGSKPPVPRPAAGALPQAASQAQNKSHRSQTAEEQKMSSSATPLPFQSSRNTSSK
jgi:hypothetical protein